VDINKSSNFLDWSRNTQNLLKDSFLGNKDLLTNMIIEAIKNPSLRSKFESHLLLDYLVIYEDEYDNRIRIHISTSEHLTRIHDHRFDFSTLVLSGGYKHILYSLKNNPYKISSEEEAISCQSLDDPDYNFYRMKESELVEMTSIRDEIPLSLYSISNKVIHSVLTKENTISIIVRSKAKKNRSFIFDTSSENILWWRFGRVDESSERIKSKIMSDKKLTIVLNSLFKLGFIHKINL